MGKKFFIILSLMILGILFLNGCGGGNDDSKVSEKENRTGGDGVNYEGVSYEGMASERYVLRNAGLLENGGALENGGIALEDGESFLKGRSLEAEPESSRQEKVKVYGWDYVPKQQTELVIPPDSEQIYIANADGDLDTGKVKSPYDRDLVDRIFWADVGGYTDKIPGGNEDRAEGYIENLGIAGLGHTANGYIDQVIGMEDGHSANGYILVAPNKKHLEEGYIEKQHLKGYVHENIGYIR